MIQRLYLITDPEGRGTFDADRLQLAIRQLNGVVNWKNAEESIDPVGTLFECELGTGDKSIVPVPIQVRRDLSCVSIGAFHDTGLRATLEIQRRYRDQIYAFSEESSPDVVALSTIGTPQELAEKLKLR